jgi:hypothetical protein
MWRLNVKRVDALGPGDRIILDERGTVVTVQKVHGDMLFDHILVEWEGSNEHGWSYLLHTDGVLEVTSK